MCFVHLWSGQQLIKKWVSEKNMSAWQNSAVIKDRTATPIETCGGRGRACLILRINFKVLECIVYSSSRTQIRGENFLLLLRGPWIHQDVCCMPGHCYPLPWCRPWGKHVQRPSALLPICSLHLTAVISSFPSPCFFFLSYLSSLLSSNRLKSCLLLPSYGGRGRVVEAVP